MKEVEALGFGTAIPIGMNKLLSSFEILIKNSCMNRWDTYLTYSVYISPKHAKLIETHQPSSSYLIVSSCIGAVYMHVFIQLSIKKLVSLDVNTALSCV